MVFALDLEPDFYTFLQRYTDAAFWDRMAGGLDERCADAWDVESEGSGDAASSAGSSPRNRPTAMEQGTGLAAARQGIAGVTWEQDATSKEQANDTMPSRCHHDAMCCKAI